MEHCDPLQCILEKVKEHSLYVVKGLGKKTYESRLLGHSVIVC